MTTESGGEFVIVETDKITKIFFFVFPLTLLVLRSHFFTLSITNGNVLIMFLLCLACFLLSNMKITAKSDGIRIQIWKAHIWRIKPQRIERIEFVRAHVGESVYLHVIFECYGCPQYTNGNIIFFSNYLQLHFLRARSCVLEKDEEDAVMQQLKDMFPHTPFLDMSDEPPVL